MDEAAAYGPEALALASRTAITSGNWATVRNSSPAAATHTSEGRGRLSRLLAWGSRSSVRTMPIFTGHPGT